MDQIAHRVIAVHVGFEADCRVPDVVVQDIRDSMGIIGFCDADGHARIRLPSGVEIVAIRRFSGPWRTDAV